MANSKSHKKRIKEFINACADKFSKEMLSSNDPFFCIVCDITSLYDINDFDTILGTKENADVFFSYFTDPDMIWVKNGLEYWGTQSAKREENWKNLCHKIEEYCMKYYGCQWGKQKAEYREQIKKYSKLKPVVTLSDFKDNMINRPLYKGNKLIGHIKDITEITVICGHHMDVDDEELINVPESKTYYACVLLYENIDKLPYIKSKQGLYKHDNKSYILGNTLDGYSVYEDKVVLS